jgi:hypothetical protein
MVTTQKITYDTVLNNPDSNYLIMGIAGSGKSYVTLLILERLLMAYGGGAVITCAWTKSAALNIFGDTICSVFSISCKSVDSITDHENSNIDDFLNKMIEGALKNNVNIETILKMRYLIIDECSMISPNLLRYIDLYLQKVFGTEDPYGGVQVILVGDVLQLPPISKLSPKYFFETKSFYYGNFSVAYFNESKRQTDVKFLEILNKIRIGKVNQNDVNQINSNWGSSVNRKFITQFFKFCMKLTQKEYVEVFNPSKINITLNQRLKDKFKHKFYATEFARTAFFYDRGKIFLDVYDKENVYDKELKSIYEKPESKLKELIQERLKVSKNTVDCSEIVNFQPPIIIGVENVETEYYNKEILIYMNKGREVKYYPSCDWQDGVLYESDRTVIDRECKLLCLLEIVVGMPVSFTSNTIDVFISNNQLGIVHSVDETTIIVTPIFNSAKSTSNINVKRETYYYKSNYYSYRREQFPLRPAYANNVYILQGMTYKSPNTAIFNNQRMSDNNYATAYTAYSRVEKSDDIFTLFPLDKRDICVNNKAVAFDEHHRSVAISETISLVDYEIESSSNNNIIIKKNNLSLEQILKNDNIVEDEDNMVDDDNIVREEPLNKKRKHFVATIAQKLIMINS